MNEIKLTKSDKRLLDSMRNGSELIRPGLGQVTWSYSDSTLPKFAKPVRVREAQIDRLHDAGLIVGNYHTGLRAS